VLDPVMVAKSGDRLLAADAVAALRERLIPMADIITPNLPEAADLLGVDSIEGGGMEEAARQLHALGPKWVLLKGGHLEGPESVDLLYGGAETVRLSAPRITTRNTHGTGCTLSSAIAALLPRHGMEEAVRRAKDYLTRALVAADRLDVGHGHGPVHHFHEAWRRDA
jgi:hydroxymethylpyrimidine/phosphomethylpyrimidine kinase